MGKKTKRNILKKIEWRYLWWLILAAIVAFTLFTVGRTLVKTLGTYAAISRLEDERDDYLRSIERDSTILEQLTYDEYLERYAREHYRMQRPGEDVYIIEN